RQTDPLPPSFDHFWVALCTGSGRIAKGAMDDPLTSRFDFLEERLQKLENVGLSEAQKTAACAEPDFAKTGSEIPVPGDRSGHGGSEAPEERGERDSLVSNARLDVLQTGVIRECQEKVALLVEEAVEGAGHRLRCMVDQMLVCFMTDIEKALQKSAGVMASQAIRLLEEEIKITTRHGLYAGLAGMKSSPAGSIAETGRAQPENKAVSTRDPHRDIEAAGRELSTAVGAIQSNPDALLTSLDTRLQATLHAFEENTAKQLAANFQNTVRELLKRELELLRTSDGRPDKEPEKQGVTRTDAAQRVGTMTEESAVHAGVGSPSPHAAPGSGSGLHGTGGNAASHTDRASVQPAPKPQKKQPTWRILGLS
ncbi:MAG: hypothetical protein ACRD2G_16400, partial [Terriglobia bacterium]